MSKFNNWYFIQVSQREKWRWVNGQEGKYCISSRGRVCSFYFKRGFRELIIKRTGGSRGYFYASVMINKKTVRVAHLVLEAFVGPRPDGYYGLHKDDKPFNNKEGNLYWGTQADNDSDRIRNGGYTFSLEQMKEIRVQRKAGASLKALACDFNTNYKHISEICRNERQFGEAV